MTSEISPARLALGGLLAALAIALLAGAPPARAASCAASNLPRGDGYITSLTVTKVGCRTGRRVALAYYRCRRRKGKAGRCTARVLGYGCRETKRVRTASPPEINARVSCRRGARTVVHTYQQIL
jgi:hypothetical protein